jgi:glycosyltransferase involved in cell wall biosynthesis
VVELTEAPQPPIDAVVVASWFPAYDDPGAGRFVADQVEALAATGVVRPAVVSFDGSRLSGGATSRGRQAAAVLGHAATAIRSSEPVFLVGASGVEPSLPVARLTIPEGSTRETGKAHAAIHRELALEALADRLGDASAGPDGLRPGIVHAHTAYPDGAAAAVLAARLGWPLIVTEHASFIGRLIAEPILRERYAAVLAGAHRVLAVSEMLAGELRAAFPEHADAVSVVPNAVPIHLFRPARLDERIPDELLFVGYRKAHKGTENLLRAVAIALRARPTITLRLVGGNADEAEERGWHALAASLGIGEAVRFEEARDRAGVAEAMAGADLFVHPSPRETFGVVAVEALASGLPVVATDSGGVSEILGADPDRLGALVAIDDPEALAAAIVRTLERRASFDPADLRASVERRFGAPYVAERLLAIYREALARTEQRRGRSIELGPGVPELTSPTVVLALDRERAARRLGPLDESLRRKLILVTAVEPATVDLPLVGRVIEIAVDASWRPPSGAPMIAQRRGLIGRLGRLAADPWGTMERRLGRGAGSDSSLAPATSAVRDLLRTLDGPADLLPLDGHDHLAAAPLVRTGDARLAAGGLRRLADAWPSTSGDSSAGDAGHLADEL